MKCRLLWFVLALFAAALALPVSALPAAADGIIIPQPPPNRPPIPWRDIPLSVKYHHVEVTIQDQVATTRVDQVFVNHAGYAVEGTYMFPLPEDAAISSFDMTVDGQRYEGKLLGRDEARTIYENIVREQRDPALLEYVGRGAFQARIFPIPPNAERRIELAYTQVLQQQGGLVHYRYPLNTEKFSAQPLQDVAVTVRVEDKAPIRAIYSPSHPVTITRDGDQRASAGYEAKNVRPDRDFDLYYSLSSDAIAVNLLSYKATGEDGFFLLLVTPPLQAQGPQQVAKDVVMVLDTSGSMDGQKIEQAKSAASYVLDHLGPSDRFNIVSFNTATRAFADQPQPLTRREDGRAFVKDLRAEGSTDINRALLEAVAGLDKTRPAVIIFLTDGLPTAGEINPDRIVANATQSAPKSVRLFTFGVGYDVDTVLLDQLSSALRGTSAYVTPNQNIDEEVSGFYSKVSSPVLVDIGVEFGGVTVNDLYPYPLPDLFAGNQLVVAGRYREGGTATLKLTGTMDTSGASKPQTFTYSDLRFGAGGGNEFIPRLWAQRKIGYLLAQIRLNGSKDELVKEVVDLSTRYGIVTPYTSFLVQEPQQALTDAGRRQLSQALQAPAAQATMAPSIGGRGGGSAPAGAPAAAPPLAPQARSGEAAVDRSVTEKQLSTESYAGAPTTPDQVRQIGNKAFVFHEGGWVDTGFDRNKMQAEMIAFGSERYFQLVKEHPELAPYLALGDRVTVVLNGQAYAIGQTGSTQPAGNTPGVETGTPSQPPATPVALSRGPSATANTGGQQPTRVAVPPTAPSQPARGALSGVCPGAVGAIGMGLLGVILPLARRRR